jgi:acyl-CoA synthetase (NDP forming)
LFEADPKVMLFRSMDRAFATLAAWHWRAGLRAQPPRGVERRAPPGARDQAAAMLANTGRVLTEREAKAAFSLYGIPVVQETLVQTADQAVAAADYPVVVKVESPDLPHKTEAGVIRLNLKNEAELRAAFAAVMENAHKVTPPPAINGVLVQPMVPQGVEMMVGARVDPLFGPLIVVGLGGIFVELMKDSAVGLAPLTHTEARGLLDRLRGKAILAGFRGSAAVDLDALADIIVRVAEFTDDHKDTVAEIDINPLICVESRILAVDALIVRPQ